MNKEFNQFLKVFTNWRLYDWNVNPVYALQNTKSIVFQEIYFKKFFSIIPWRNSDLEKYFNSRTIYLSSMTPETLKKFLRLSITKKKGTKEDLLKNGLKNHLNKFSFSHDFNPLKCYESRFNFKNCFYDPYGFAQLNLKRWGYIYLIEEALKTNPKSVSPTALKDYKYLKQTIESQNIGVSGLPKSNNLGAILFVSVLAACFIKK